MIALGMALLSAASPCAARSNEEHAEELFRQGQALLQAGRLPEACARLGDSLRLDAALGTLLNLALCHEREGRVATAHREYATAARWASERRENDREQFAKERVVELEKRLSKIRFEWTTSPRDLEVELDGRRLETAQLEEEIVVDPGAHRVELRRAGQPAWRRRDLWIELPGVTVVAIGLDDVSAGGPSAISTSRPSPVGYIVGGAGLAALGVGIALLLRADALDEESQREAERARKASPPDAVSKAAALERYESAITSQNVGLAAAGLGIAGVGASLYFLLNAHPAEPSTLPRAMRISPRIGPHAAGLQIEGRF
jgi:tetratricopeptide (TPR) repeat protein